MTPGLTAFTRIGALAGMADELGERARAWRILDDGHENYQLLQALIGAWPLAGSGATCVAK